MGPIMKGVLKVSKKAKDQELKEKETSGTPEKKEPLEKNSDEEIQKLKKELQDQKELFLRTAAEYDNYRKRTQKDRVLIYNEALSDAVAEFLPLADNFELALSSIKESSNEEYVKGLEMLKKQFDEILKKLKVEAFGEVGENFDPNVHNAVAHVEVEALDENSLSQVFRKGYKIGDKVIRYAMVQVAN